MVALRAARGRQLHFCTKDAAGGGFVVTGSGQKLGR